MKPAGFAPSPEEFPRVSLWWPVALALTPPMFGECMELGGHVWSMHGDVIFLGLASLAALSVALVASHFAFPRAVCLLRRHQPLRTLRNVGFTVLNGLFLLASVCYGAVLVALPD